MDLKFTQTGKFLIASGSHRETEDAKYDPVLFISVVGDQGWATRYPMPGGYSGENEAAAAALHYGIQIITRQCRDVKQPGH